MAVFKKKKKGSDENELKVEKKKEKVTLSELKNGFEYTKANFSGLYENIHRMFRGYVSTLLKKNKESVIGVYVALLILFMVFISILSVVSFATLRSSILNIPVLLSVVFAILPFAVWVWSTTTDYWCYLDRKKFFFKLCYIHTFVLVMLHIYRMAYKLVVGYVAKIPYTLFLDVKGHESLTQGAVFYLTAGLGMLVGYAFFNKSFFETHLINEFITTFKLGHHVDFRDNKENLYDFEILNELSTGKPLKVKETDRFTGTLVNGQSGTGKTSTIFTTSIGEDLRKKLKNLENCKTALYQMVCQGKLKLKPGINEPVLACGEFNANAFIATGDTEAEIDENTKAYKKVLETYPNCGITAIAPNDGLINDVIGLCKKLHLKVNVVDPLPDEKTKKYKDNYTGINPFYINPAMTEEEKRTDISDKAAMFADIMASINDESGSTDVYFADINKSVTVNVAIVNMVAIYGMYNRQADIFDMQACINDFSILEERVKYIEDNYGSVKVNFAEIPSKNKKRKQDDQKGTDNISNSFIDSATGSVKMSIDEYIEEESSETEGKTAKANENNVLLGTDNPYSMVIYFVKRELLGPGREKMEDQSRGLRNQINNFLMNPHINRVFKYKERILDFDRMFREGEVTVVNTALQLGDSQSKAFGLYIILLFRQAMFRRPMETRVCRHWCYIDELPVYLHPKIESIYSLARQYRCGFYSALQTLDQMEKNATTKYLKGVLMGAGTHIVFGRVNNSEMKLYSDLGGMKLQEHVKHGASKSSILEDSGNYSYTETKDYTADNIIQGYDIRNRDFAELTFFTSDNGHVLDVKSAKAHFINMDKFDNVERATYDWSMYVEKENPVETIFENEEEKTEANKLADNNKVYSITPDSMESDMSVAISEEAMEVIGKMPEPVTVAGPFVEEPVINISAAENDMDELDVEEFDFEEIEQEIESGMQKVANELDVEDEQPQSSQTAYDILSQYYR